MKRFQDYLNENEKAEQKLGELTDKLVSYLMEFIDFNNTEAWSEYDGDENGIVERYRFGVDIESSEQQELCIFVTVPPSKRDEKSAITIQEIDGQFAEKSTRDSELDVDAFDPDPMRAISIEIRKMLNDEASTLKDLEYFTNITLNPETQIKIVHADPKNIKLLRNPCREAFDHSRKILGNVIDTFVDDPNSSSSVKALKKSGLFRFSVGGIE